jgi:prepilin-type N-terminal cleavage/methylation domain-containing protein
VRAGWAQGPREPTDGGSPPEGGFTLVEVLIALAILSIAIFVVVGGMNVLVLSSRLNRSQGDVGSVVRRAAEAVQGDDYIACSPGASTYSLHMPAQASQLPENQSAPPATNVANPVNAANAPRVQLPFIAKITSFDDQTTLWTQPSGWQNCSNSGLEVVQITDSSADGAISQSVNVVKAPSS